PCRQGSHGRNLLSRAQSGRVAVCGSRSGGQRRRALVHHRGHEASQRDRSRQVRRDQGNPGRKWRAGRVRSTFVCDRLTCSKKSSLPTVARSPCVSSALVASWASRRLSSILKPTAMPSTYVWRTSRCVSDLLPPATAI